MAVQTALSVLLSVLETNISENQQGSVTHSFDVFKALGLDSGTSSGQADKVFSDRRTLASGANENLDLAGSLTGAFGGSVTFVKVKLLVIYNRTSGQTLTYKRGATNPFTGVLNGGTDGILITGGGFFFWYDPSGSTVTAATGDIVNIANSAGTAADYDIFVIGTSA